MMLKFFGPPAIKLAARLYERELFRLLADARTLFNFGAIPEKNKGR